MSMSIANSLCIFRKAYGLVLKPNFLACSKLHSDSAELLFLKERERQISSVKRVETIQVTCNGIEDSEVPVILQMNKHLSTPYSCTKHIGELYSKQSALALVNGKPWQMHKPLTAECELEFLHFKQDDPTIVNKAFWRSCAFILGSVLTRAFKPENKVRLHSPRDFAIESGSFAYDFAADFGTWEATEREMLILSQMATKLSYGIGDKRNYYFIEPLDVATDKVKHMFHDNRYKLSQIEALRSDQDSVSVYRMGTHIDMIDGPLISNANHLGRFNVTAIHRIGDADDGTGLYRAQGIALPSCITMHSWTYKALLKNATALNETEEIIEQEEEEEEEEIQEMESQV